MFPLQLNDGRRRFEHLGEVELNWEEGHYNCSNYKIVHWRPRHDSTSPAIFFLYSSLWGYLFWCSSITSSHTTMMARLCSAARVMISFSASFWLPYSYIVEMSILYYFPFIPSRNLLTWISFLLRRRDLNFALTTLFEIEAFHPLRLIFFTPDWISLSLPPYPGYRLRLRVPPPPL